jgi:hypothetical protein
MLVKLRDVLPMIAQSEKRAEEVGDDRPTGGELTQQVRQRSSRRAVGPLELQCLDPLP